MEGKTFGKSSQWGSLPKERLVIDSDRVIQTNSLMSLIKDSES